ncbi:MAG: hypothetical protein ACRD5E_02540 [Nitrososphaeraceae archaeon]
MGGESHRHKKDSEKYYSQRGFQLATNLIKLEHQFPATPHVFGASDEVLCVYTNPDIHWAKAGLSVLHERYGVAILYRYTR